jgi:hypothetical protein
VSNHQTLRIEPPSPQANNQDVFVWALYLLGGADKDVDVEEIYLKCFELAPARLGWRTRPDLPDYKKASKALQSIEAKTHVGLVLRPHEYSRRLTSEGVRWIETYSAILERNYQSGPVAASATNNKYENRRTAIKMDPVWSAYLRSPENLTSVDLASILQCGAASPDATWKSRINDLKRISDVLQDAEIMEFANFVSKKVLGES